MEESFIEQTFEKVTKIVDSCTQPEQFYVALRVVERLQSIIDRTEYQVSEGMQQAINFLRSVCEQSMIVGEDFGDCNSI